MVAIADADLLSKPLLPEELADAFHRNFCRPFKVSTPYGKMGQ